MKYIDVLNLKMVNLLAENPEEFYVDNDIYLALSASTFGQKNLRIGQPYRVEEGRLVMVTAGWSRIIANLEEYELHTGMAFVLPPDSILEIVEHSDDLDMRAVTFKDLPLSAGFNHAICLQLTEQDVADIDNLLMLLWQEVHRTPKHHEIIHHRPFSQPETLRAADAGFIQSRRIPSGAVAPPLCGPRQAIWPDGT